MKKYLSLSLVTLCVACVTPTHQSVELSAGLGSYTRTLPIYLSSGGAVNDNEPEFSFTDIREDGVEIAGRKFDTFGRLSIGEGTIENGTRQECHVVSSEAHGNNNGHVGKGKGKKKGHPKNDDKDEPTTSCSTIPQQKTTLLTYTLGLRNSVPILSSDRLFFTYQAGLRAGVAFGLGHDEFEFGPDVEASLTYRVNDGRLYFGPYVGAWAPIDTDLPGSAAILPRIGLILGFTW